MVKACCVSTCREEWMPNRSVSFFAFPFNNEEMKEKWLQAGIGWKTISKNSVVCSNHFLPEDYTDWTAYGGMRKLKKNAVPSIFDSKCSTRIDYKEPQATNLQDPSDQFDAVARSSLKRLRESIDDDSPARKLCVVAVQTCPRLSGPSVREKELQAKIHALQSRLRRRDARISNIKNLVVRLKNAAKPPLKSSNVRHAQNLEPGEISVNGNDPHLNDLSRRCTKSPPTKPKRQTKTTKIGESSTVQIAKIDDSSTMKVTEPNCEKEKRADIRLIHLEQHNKDLKRPNVKFIAKAANYRKLNEQLGTKLRVAKLRNAVLVKKTKKKTVDEFLDENGCVEAAARTMVKLLLHRKNAPFTDDEKNLARQLFCYSAPAYKRLIQAGCSLPAVSTVRLWITENDNEPEPFPVIDDE